MNTFVPNLLEGQAAVITGGGSGLGLAIAEAYASHGASVLIASRNAERLEAAGKQLARHGHPVETFPLDVRKSADVDRMIDHAWEKFGRLDHLVNNAAGNFFSPASQMSDNAFAAVLNIDLFGTFYCSRAAAQRWQDKDKPGRILNISMTLHYRGFPGMVHASSAKAGIDAMTHTLAVEWAPLIRVNAIAPGPIPRKESRKPSKSVVSSRCRRTPSRWDGGQARGHRPSGAVPGLARGGLDYRDHPGGGRRRVAQPPHAPAVSLTPGLRWPAPHSWRSAAR